MSVCLVKEKHFLPLTIVKYVMEWQIATLYPNGGIIMILQYIERACPMRAKYTEPAVIVKSSHRMKNHNKNKG